MGYTTLLEAELHQDLSRLDNGLREAYAGFGTSKKEVGRTGLAMVDINQCCKRGALATSGYVIVGPPSKQ